MGAIKMPKKKFKNPEELENYLEDLENKVTFLKDKIAEKDIQDKDTITDFDKWFYGEKKEDD